MNDNVKEEWVTALRSGEYTQATGALREFVNGEVVGYCCLGVLCDLAIKDGVEGVRDNGGQYEVACIQRDEEDFYSEASHSDWHPHEDEGALPRPVAEWAGLHEFEPKVDGIYLSAYNDGRRSDEDGSEEIRPHDFAEIADIIEKGL